MAASFWIQLSKQNALEGILRVYLGPLHMGFVIRTPGPSSQLCQFWGLEAIRVCSPVCKMAGVWERGLDAQRDSQRTLTET